MRINTFLILFILFIFNCSIFNNIKKKEEIYIEKEYKNSKGLNDKFETAENITFNNRVMGYIGAEFDIDNYLINNKEEGILSLKIDISKSFSEKKIFFLVLTVYSGNWLGSNTASCATDPGLPDNYIIDKDNIKYSNNFIEIKQSVNAKHDKYFIRINVIGGNAKYKGFDIDNPYILTVNFAPGKTLESDQPDKNSGIKDADICDDANKITFNNDNFGTSIITSYAYYKIKTDKNIDGEVNLILDYNDSYKKYGLFDELSCYKNPYGIKIWLYVYKASILEKTRDTNLYINCSVKNFSSFQKTTFFSAKNTTYYILVNSRANWDTENPYTLTVSYNKFKKEIDFDNVAKKN